MPPKIKITKEMIIETAFEIVRTEGIDKLTVRSIAKSLNCSTQPILYNYEGVEEIRRIVYERADRYHSEYIMPAGSGRISPLMELGMNYIRFGYEEKHLFQFLFQSNQFSGLKLKDLTEDPQLGEILKLVAMAARTDAETAKEMFLSLFITAHGCASLLAGNAMEYEEDRFAQLLKNAMRGVMREGERKDDSKDI